MGAYFRANEGGTTEVSFRPFFRGEGFLFFIKQAVTTHKKLPKNGREEENLNNRIKTAYGGKSWI